MPLLRATITVTVAADGSLVYTITGDGIPVTPKKHRVKKGTEVEWICPPGGLGIVFTESPFTSGETVLPARQNVSTGFNKTKKKKTYKYTAVVSRPGDPDLRLEDPDLDVSDDGGGGRAKSKHKSTKKRPPKKKKK